MVSSIERWDSVSRMHWRLLGILGGSVSCLLFGTSAHAQCSKDNDCKGDRVCEAGACVAPPPTAAGDPVTGAVAAPSTATPSVPTANTETARAPAYAPPLAEPGTSPESASEPEKKVAMRRHSTGMMAGGIVMVSFVPVALLVAWVANLEQHSCEGDGFLSIDGSESRGAGVNCGRFDPTIYGGLITAAALAGAGIPMIVIGGKKEPVGLARVTPWATAHSLGLGLRLDL
jgi:hypothetical protein